MRIISNTSPLIALVKIGKLNLLEYDIDIVIPRAVFEEMTRFKREYAKELQEWGKNKVIEVKNKKAVEYLELIVDKGEAETVVLGEELNADAVLIDDLKARKIARLRGLTVIGTIGLLLDAKNKGLVSEVNPLLEELIKKKIRISNELYDHALKLANEKGGYK